MLKVAILFAIGTATLVTLSASLLPAPPPGSPPHGQLAVTTPAGGAGAGDDAKPRTAGYREAVVQADPRGQYAADALVNGLPVRMLVDTGASVVVLSAATAARLGVSAGPAKWRMNTASGVVDASPVTLDAVSLGGLYMDHIQAVVLPRDAGDANLLGATFLKRLVSVEQRDGLLILRQ